MLEREVQQTDGFLRMGLKPARLRSFLLTQRQMITRDAFSSFPDFFTS